MRAFVRAFRCPAGMLPATVRSDLAANNPEAIIETIKPGGIENEFFLEMIAAQTLLAKASGSLLARKPEVDLLLRLAGTTQISTAISQIGSKDGDPFLVVVASRGKVSAPGYLASLALSRNELSREELERIEKAALLDAERA